MAPELGAFPVNYGICSVDFAARLNIQTVVVQLAVQFVAVGDHDQRRVLHRRLLQQLARIAAHGYALALPVPEHARLVRAGLCLVAIGGSAFADGVNA